MSGILALFSHYLNNSTLYRRQRMPKHKHTRCGSVRAGPVALTLRCPVGTRPDLRHSPDGLTAVCRCRSASRGRISPSHRTCVHLDTRRTLPERGGGQVGGAAGEGEGFGGAQMDDPFTGTTWTSFCASLYNKKKYARPNVDLLSVTLMITFLTHFHLDWKTKRCGNVEEAEWKWPQTPSGVTILCFYLISRLGCEI